jgi:hypothetical protein
MKKKQGKNKIRVFFKKKNIMLFPGIINICSSRSQEDLNFSVKRNNSLPIYPLEIAFFIIHELTQISILYAFCEFL